MNVVFDMLSGEAVIGEQRIATVDAGPDGTLHVGAEGLELRPVTFGERTRIVTRAALSPHPPDSLAAGVTAVALSAAIPPPDERDAIEVLALVLAGAEASGPPFSAAMVDLHRAAGWSTTDILEAPAAEVDRLVATLVREPDDGWTRVEFDSDPAAAEPALGIAAIRTQLAENLLRRVDVPESAPSDARFEDPPPQTADTAPASPDDMPGRGNPDTRILDLPAASAHRPDDATHPPAPHSPRRWQLAPPPTANEKRPGSAAGPRRRDPHSARSRDRDAEQPERDDRRHADESGRAHHVANGAGAPGQAASAAPTAGSVLLPPDSSRLSATATPRAQRDPIVTTPAPAELVRTPRRDHALSAAVALKPVGGAPVPAPTSTSTSIGDAPTSAVSNIMSPTAGARPVANLDARDVADRLAFLLEGESDLRGLAR